MHQFFVKGRFPEDNTAAPKTPLPVISIFFPNVGRPHEPALASNDLQFMQDLATPEIGGFFDIVKAGPGRREVEDDPLARQAALQPDVGREVAARVPRAHGRAVVPPRRAQRLAAGAAGRDVQGRPHRRRPDVVAARHQHRADEGRGRREPAPSGRHVPRLRRLLLGRREDPRRGVLRPRGHEPERERQPQRPRDREEGDPEPRRPEHARQRGRLGRSRSSRSTSPTRTRSSRGRARTRSRASSSTTTRRSARAASPPRRCSR